MSIRVYRCVPCDLACDVGPFIMGGGASKSDCVEAGYYKETTEVGDVDDGFKVVDFHGSGLASFFLGLGLGAAAAVCILVGWRKTMGRCAPRQHTNIPQTQNASFSVADQAVAFTYRPPLALPAPPPAYTPAYAPVPVAPYAPPSDAYARPRYSPSRFEEVPERARGREDTAPRARQTDMP